MIVSNKEILYINALIENAVDLFHNFWPMTSFIHHNPLHGFESMHFEEAVKKAQTYFHNKKFLSREEYQKFYKQGKIKKKKLEMEIEHYCNKNRLDDIYKDLFFHIMTQETSSPKEDTDLKNSIRKKLSLLCATPKPKRLGVNFGFCDALDNLYGTEVCEEINNKMNQIAMRHLDEGQATWKPLDKHKGLYSSWKVMIKNDQVFFNKSLQICRILSDSDKPEDIIYWILTELKIPKNEWEDFFVLQFGKLHGWTGFLRWRSTNEEYIYQKKYPAYLEEFLAIRLYFLYFYLKKFKKDRGFFPNYVTLKNELSKKENFLRIQYNNSDILPDFIERYERCEYNDTLSTLYEEYMKAYNQNHIKNSVDFLHNCLVNFNYNIENYEELLGVLKNFEEEEGFLWQKAMENSYIEELMKKITATIESRSKEKKDAQFFFCIDVRSENIRRAVESVGNFETFGVGGFFGIPLKLIDITKKHESNLCPAVVKPKNIIYKFDDNYQNVMPRKLKNAIKHIYHDLKYDTMSGYIMVETIGLLFGFDFLGKTFWPNFYMPKREKIFSQNYSGKLLVDKYSKKEIYHKINSLQKELVKIAVKDIFALDVSPFNSEIDEFLEIATSTNENIITFEKNKIEPKSSLGKALNLLHFEEIKLLKILKSDYHISYYHKLKHIEKLSKVGFTFKEQLFYARNMLKLTGLTSDFAPFVFLCGHESKSQNNPYESALDCGACGGNSSDTNARVLSYILNKKDIREALKPDIVIPPKTIFISALHNTVTDKIKIDKQNIPTEKKDEISTIEQKLDKASEISALQRVKKLPFGKNLNSEQALKFIEKNTQDWSQTRPEWGLATNHSFIIGPREISSSIEFDNRVFLHSYDYKKDKKGYFLEIILSAPLVIGEWINMEHFFSSLDNKAFGSESKVYHNVVGRFGIVSGNISDLRTGLAAQSVHLAGEIYHEPVRLLTFIDAPFKKYKHIIDKIKKVSELVYNEWIKMIFIDRTEKAFFYYNANTQKWDKINFDSLKELK